jgi:hypothetical protein
MDETRNLQGFWCPTSSAIADSPAQTRIARLRAFGVCAAISWIPLSLLIGAASSSALETAASSSSAAPLTRCGAPSRCRAAWSSATPACRPNDASSSASAFRASTAINPDLAINLLMLAASVALQGQDADARETLQRYLALPIPSAKSIAQLRGRQPYDNPFLHEIQPPIRRVAQGGDARRLVSGPCAFYLFV